MRTFWKWLFIAACVPAIGAAAIPAAVAAHAADAMQTKTVGSYRVELYVLPAEPFFSKADVAAKNVKEGMEIEGVAPLRSGQTRIRTLIIISSCTSSIRRPAR